MSQKNSPAVSIQDERADAALRIATACEILASALLDPIGSNLPTHFSDPNLVANWPLDNAATRPGIELLQEAIQSGQGVGTIEAIKRDHLYLFGGVGKPLACPYESPYVNKDGLVFDAATFSVRACYSRYGFQIQAFNREPDDHLGYELAFTSLLSKIISDSPHAGKANQDLAHFTAEHLTKFGYSVAEGVAFHADTIFYRACAHLITGVLDELRNFTGDSVEETAFTAGP